MRRQIAAMLAMFTLHSTEANSSILHEKSTMLNRRYKPKIRKYEFRKSENLKI